MFYEILICFQSSMLLLVHVRIASYYLNCDINKLESYETLKIQTQSTVCVSFKPNP